MLTLLRVSKYIIGVETLLKYFCVGHYETTTESSHHCMWAASGVVVWGEIANKSQLLGTFVT
jgi:hypothetical protein